MTKRRQRRVNEQTCACQAYPFPHRSGGGKCPGGNETCPECHRACQTITEVSKGLFGKPHTAYFSKCCHVWLFNDYDSHADD